MHSRCQYPCTRIHYSFMFCPKPKSDVLRLSSRAKHTQLYEIIDNSRGDKSRHLVTKNVTDRDQHLSRPAGQKLLKKCEIMIQSAPTSTDQDSAGGGFDFSIDLPPYYPLGVRRGLGRANKGRRVLLCRPR